MDEFEKGDKGVELDGLGLRLKSARENKGLSIDSVAHQLNISQQRILDMESNDYRFAVAESYAKGFLRAYAKLLGLDSALIINEFDRMKYGDTIHHQITKLIVKRQASASDSWMRWLTYSIAIILVVMVGIWWQNQPNHSDIVTAVGSTPQSTTDISSQVAPKIETTSNTSGQNVGDESGSAQKSDPQTTQLLQDSPGTDQDNAQPATNSASSSTTGTENTTTPSTPSSLDSTATGTAQSNQPNSVSAPTVNGASTTGTSTSTQSKPTESHQPNSTPGPASNGSSTTSTTQSQSDADSTEATDSEESSEEESDDEELDDETVDDQQGFNTIKGLKPKVILGQREKDERALLMELEKIFGRG
jgi:cytoskeleton protein RodZ